MSGEPFHDFGQDGRGRPKNSDILISLPKIFDLVEEENGFCVKRMIGDGSVKRLDITFYGPGSAILPIHYRKTMHSTESQYISMEALQEGKVIASANGRYTKSEPFDFMPKASSQLPRPFDCPTLKEAKLAGYLDEWTIKYGTSLNITKLGLRSELFEVRPIDFEYFAGLTYESKKMQCWARLAPHLQHVDIQEPMFVPLTICDYVACHPAIIALDQRKLYFKSGASLNHKVVIHRTSGFDPHGFFYVENFLDALSNGGTGLYVGKVFDEAGNCILSFSQMNFNLIDTKKPEERAKI